MRITFTRPNPNPKPKTHFHYLPHSHFKRRSTPFLPHSRPFFPLSLLFFFFFFRF